MSCCGGDREKAEKITKTEQWDYINLSDFRVSSCFQPLSYGILYISLVISVAVYCVDSFTAVQLLLFDKWSGAIKPVVRLEIARWVFFGCIILSFVLLIYRWLRALRVIRRGGVVQSYLDPLAVRLQSARMGKNGRGWRRFLVFAELTKSKKGVENIALFVHFSFEAWTRIIFAEGPRQVINALTLYSVMQAEIIPVGDHSAPKGSSPVMQFFINVKTMSDGNTIRAVIVFGMLFTLIIWLFAFLSLAIACILYLVFLWHHIPTQDGGIRRYCKRKIDSRLQKIVGVKVNKALAKEDMKRSKEQLKAGGSDIKRQPTIPILGDDSLASMPTLTRQPTEATLPPYTSRPGTSQGGPVPGLARQPTFPDSSPIGQRPPQFPARTATQSSAASFRSNASLLSSAAPMGYDEPVPYAPSLSRVDSDRSFHGGRPPLARTMTGASQASQGSFMPSGRPGGPPARQNTGMSSQSDGRFTTAPPFPRPLQRSETGMTDASGRFTPQHPARQNTGPAAFNINGRNSPALGGPGPRPYSPALRGPVQEFEMRSQSPQVAPPSNSGNSFVAYNPSMNSATTRSMTASPSRNFSTPVRPQQGFGQSAPPQRSGTAPIPSSAAVYDDSIYDSYGSNSSQPQAPARSATAGPNNSSWY